MNLNERRITLYGLISVATRRDGAIFLQSCVVAHLCSVTTTHSRRLVLPKNDRRRDSIIGPIGTRNIVFLHRAIVISRATVADTEIFILGVVIAFGKFVAVPTGPRITDIERSLTRMEMRFLKAFTGKWIFSTDIFWHLLHLLVEKVVDGHGIGPLEIEQYFTGRIGTARG